MRQFHSIRASIVLAAVLVSWTAPTASQQAPPAPAVSSSFTIFLRGTAIGTEQIAVERAGGWTITSSGRLGPPIDTITQSLQVRYDENWQPLSVVVDGSVRGQTSSLRTTVSGATARSESSVGGPPEAKVDTIDPAAVLLLPGPFFAPYEAVSVRLKTAVAGTALPAYISSQVPIILRVGESTTEQIQTLARIISARRTRIIFEVPGAQPTDAEVWADEEGRLLRLSIPSQSLDAVREDLASVSTRRVPVSRAGDLQVTIPANGFLLAGTISKPAGAGSQPLPAVVLVGGSGTRDRDESVFGIPIFGQLAGALADAGFMVLRYDKRGIGQSGGRDESATLADYAEDLRAAVRFMSARRDVDRRRLAVVGYSEGGAVALIAGAKENRIGALALIAAPGTTGAELNLWQAQHALARSSRPEADKQATIELQKKIQAAVLTGKGWEDIPPDLRRQADIPWFQSFLAFDPARVMRDVDQPILVLQPLLDTEVPPVNADRLEAAARARRKVVPVEVITLPGLNHLLVPATTGETSEYGELKDKNVGAAVATSIAGWLQKTFTARR